jgi:hypothetical protein
MKFTSHVGMNYIGGNGRRLFTFQALHDGRAYGSVDIDDGLVVNVMVGSELALRQSALINLALIWYRKTGVCNA